MSVPFPEPTAAALHDVGDSSAHLAPQEATQDAGGDDVASRAKRKSGYLTAYACEGSRLQINCTQDRYLDIIRANYGRFSIAICNDHGNTDWSVNCMSPRTLRVIEAR